MLQFSSSFLSILKTLPNSCVYALISDSNMSCIVSHSNALKSRIGALIEYFNKDDCRLVILQNTDDLESKLLLCEKYKQIYNAAGYEICNTRQYINYKVSIQYSYEIKEVHVVLYNARRYKNIVARFDNINEAKEFVDKYYSDKFIMPVYGIGKNRYSEAARTK